MACKNLSKSKRLFTKLHWRKFIPGFNKQQQQTHRQKHSCEFERDQNVGVNLPFHPAPSILLPKQKCTLKKTIKTECSANTQAWKNRKYNKKCGWNTSLCIILCIAVPRQVCITTYFENWPYIVRVTEHQLCKIQTAKCFNSVKIQKCLLLNEYQHSLGS